MAKNNGLTAKRQREILSALACAALKRLHISEVVYMHASCGASNWEMIFAGAADESEVKVFVDVIEEGGINDVELDQLMQPFLADEICQALGARKVTIAW